MSLDKMLRDGGRSRREKKRRCVQQDMIAEERGAWRRARRFENRSKLILERVHRLRGRRFDLPPSMRRRGRIDLSHRHGRWRIHAIAQWNSKYRTIRTGIGTPSSHSSPYFISRSLRLPGDYRSGQSACSRPFRCFRLRRLLSPAQARAAMLHARRSPLRLWRPYLLGFLPLLAAGLAREQPHCAGQESAGDDRKNFSHVNLHCCFALPAFARRSRSRSVQRSARCAPALARLPSPRPHAAAVVAIARRHGRARDGPCKEAKRTWREDLRACPGSSKVNARTGMRRADLLFRRHDAEPLIGRRVFFKCDVRRGFVAPAVGYPFALQLPPYVARHANPMQEDPHHEDCSVCRLCRDHRHRRRR